MRSSGFQLRKDDPIALRDLILKVQEASGCDAAKSIPQTELLNTILRAIRNNNVSKVTKLCVCSNELFTDRKYIYI